LKTTRAESSGGVVLRSQSGTFEVVLVGRVEQGTWALPKGTPQRGETREETALRETREETGLDVRIVGPIDSITYWFMLRHTRVAKSVYYYLMVSTGGDTSRHDPEYDRVAWFPVQRALTVMTYPNEADMIRRAIDRYEHRNGIPATTVNDDQDGSAR
jgi:8-oxo-dGTP pyrophosphatase MutT (NUDIX family)